MLPAAIFVALCLSLTVMMSSSPDHVADGQQTPETDVIDSAYGRQTPETDAIDSVMKIYTYIKWGDALNPRYINLNNDQFLIESEEGLQFWDVPSNSLSRPKFPGNKTRLDLGNPGGRGKWVRLGNAPAGTAFVGVVDSVEPHTLFWWNEETRQFSSSLEIENKYSPPALITVGSHYLLLCWKKDDRSRIVRHIITTSKLVHLNQSEGTTSLEWVQPNDPEAKVAILSAGIIGQVDGFDPIAENDVNQPVFYDVSLCGWEINNSPEDTRWIFDKAVRSREPTIKPYFLSDGRVLLGEDQLRQSLLWDVETNSWIRVEAPMEKSPIFHREGTDEPVMSFGFSSKIVEFLDTKTMKWVRSRQRLPNGIDANIEPLRNGNALVMMREFGGVVGIVAPIDAVTRE